ncbi:MAG: glycosyltransferase [Elusimicrobiota bacterium]
MPIADANIEKKSRVMKITLVPDQTSPYGEDAFCREFCSRAAARGHQTQITPVAPGPVASGFAQGSDVVLINSYQSAAIRAARAAGKKTAVRLIDSFTELPAEELAAIRADLNQADALLMPSQYLARLAAGWGFAGRFHTVPYAYDRVRANQITLVTIRASRTDFQIITSSKFNESCRAGLELLISALAELRLDWHLSIVGTGPILASIQDRVRQRLPADRVVFAGDLPHLKVMEFFRAAKAYVNPSGEEGFPSMALYALSEGCPVVVPRIGAMPELISDGKNGLLFDPGRPASLTSNLVKLWAERGLSLQLIAEGIKTVERHTWDATVAAAFTALEDMVR